MKKIIVGVIIVICLVCAYSLGYSNGMEKVSKHFYGNTNNEENKVTEKDKKTKEFEKEGYLFDEKIKVNVDDFNNVKYLVSDDITATKLIVKNDGSIIKFNLGKKFSNESHVLKLSSKITGEIAVGIVDENCEDYWFVMKDYTILKVDTINDKITKEKELPNDIMFRSNEIIRALKKIKYDMIISEGHFYIQVLKDNIIYNWDYDNTAEYNINPFADEYKNGEVPNNEQVVLLDYQFIRTNNAIYKYCLLNEEEVKKYADVKEKYGYQKLEISKYLNEIVYIDAECAIMNDGTVYI